MTHDQNILAIYAFSLLAVMLMILTGVVYTVFFSNPSKVKPYMKTFLNRLLGTLVATSLCLVFVSVKFLLLQ